eukprot:TRINITY_DN4909_c0_g1_i1.p1 TRINITY_DN4909_c0_g1~~TRINITY_DN4909_c0_g1_i1.p1  ORF type:complete len:125 (+),score=32.98 TRINITY_DN4909_c0_g1_i1:210-584(+)
MQKYERDEALLEELGHQAAMKVENDTWRQHLSVMEQGAMKSFWKKMRMRCYDYWMDEIDNDHLMHAHGVLQEAVGRCSSSLKERSSHVKLAGVCHEEIVMLFERCAASRSDKQAKVPSPAKRDE